MVDLCHHVQVIPEVWNYWEYSKLLLKVKTFRSTFLFSKALFQLNWLIAFLIQSVVHYGDTRCTLFSLSSKNKKSPPPGKFLIFQKMELSSSNIKKFLIFSYISGHGNPPQKIPYVSLNRNPKKASYISRNGTWHFLSPDLKK